jgi:hypothetical protein
VARRYFHQRRSKSKSRAQGEVDARLGALSEDEDGEGHERDSAPRRVAKKDEEDPRVDRADKQHGGQGHPFFA